MVFGSPLSLGGGFDLGQGLFNTGAALFGGNPNQALMNIYAQAADPLVGINAAQTASLDAYTNQVRANQKITYNEGIQEAKKIIQEAKDYMGQQSFDYSNSGVLIEGSPVAQLNRTRSIGRQAVTQALFRTANVMKGMEYQIQQATNDSKARMFGQKIALETDRANQMAGLAAGGGGNLGAALSGLGNSLGNVYFNPFASNTANSLATTGGLFSNLPKGWGTAP